MNLYFVVDTSVIRTDEVVAICRVETEEIQIYLRGAEDALSFTFDANERDEIFNNIVTAWGEAAKGDVTP